MNKSEVLKEHVDDSERQNEISLYCMKRMAKLGLAIPLKHLTNLFQAVPQNST